MIELHEPIYKYDNGSDTSINKGVKNETTFKVYPIYYYILGGVALGFIVAKGRGL